jgi:ABC-type glycerol-3-phosphate transport system substrate-binding protein
MARRVMMLLAIASLGVLALAFAGCGGSDKSAATTETTATTTTETTTESTTGATDTTATDTTATETTDTTETETTDTSTTPDFASSENCRQFAAIGQKISSSLTGGESDLGDVAKAFHQYADASPADIKDDFQTLADWFDQVAGALGNLKAGQTPSAADLAKLQTLDSTKATQASQNISTWVQQNCTS